MRLEISGFWVQLACYPPQPQGPGGAAAHVFEAARSRRPVFSVSGDGIEEAMACARAWIGQQIEPEPTSRSQAIPTEAVQEEECESAPIVWELKPLMLPPAPT